MMAIAVLLCFMSSPAHAQDITSGLVGHWKMDETTGTTASDSSGNGYDLSLQNGLDAGNDSVSGKIGNALEFDSTDDYASNAGIDLSNTNVVTVALWSNRSYSGSGGNTLLEFTTNLNSSTTGFGIFPDDAGDCGGAILVMHEGDAGYEKNCYTQPTSDEWHHLAAIYDKSQSAGSEISFYIDGILQTPASQPATSNNTNNFGNEPFYLSSRGGSIEFNANIMDDVRIYNRALTAEDVAELAATTYPGKMRYNTGYRTLEYHDGKEWVGIDRTGKPTTDGLVGHWEFDEDGGTTAADSAGSNDGAMQGGLDAGANSVPGQAGKALDFDGTDDYVETAADDSFCPSKLTVSAWIKRSASETAGTVVGKAGSFDFGLRNGRTVIHAFGSADKGWSFSDTEGSVVDSSWNHLALRYDGTQVEIYLNGVIDAVDSTYTGNMACDPTAKMQIGTRLLNTIGYFAGTIDDVRIYNRALSATEIQDLYEFTRATGFNEKKGLVGHWKLDETSGTTAADSTGNNDGTMEGGLDGGTDSVAGQIGTALNFDGSDDYIDVPDPGADSVFDIEVGDAFTLAAWIYPQALSNFGEIIIKGEASGSTINYAMDHYNDQLAFAYRRESDLLMVTYRTSGSVLSVGEWAHVAVTHVMGDPSAAKLYIDGVEVPGSWAQGAGNEAPVAQNDVSLKIGGGTWAADHVAGRIDDVRIYDRALSDYEVHALYFWGERGGPQCANPVGDPGKIIYNTTHDVMQYCDGENWVAMGPVPGAGGANCSLPSGSTGAMIFNSSENVLQYCDGTNWRAVAQRDCPHIGDECADGTFYIGDSPADGKRVYMTSSAHETTTTWHEDPPCYRCGDGNIANSNSDGRANVEALRAYDGETATAGTLDGFGAAKYCDNLNDVHGHSDWYLPAGGGSSSTEIYLIWKMLQAAGNVAGLDTSGNWYWSSTENSADSARRIKFDTGSQINSGSKENSQVIRCVRR